MQINEPTTRWLYLPGMTRDRTHSPDGPLNELRLPLLGYLPNKARNHFVAIVGEFAGTFLFLFCAFSATQVSNTAQSGAAANDTSIADYPDTGTLIYIALAFGFSLAVNAWVFFRISGGLFNPAVTFALVLIGSVGWVRGLLVAVTQILAATSAAGIVYVLFPGELQVATTLGGKTSVVQGLFIEALLTAQLIFTIIMLAAEKHKGTFLAPIGIGLSLFISELTGVYFTGGSLNPARSFGPAVVLHSFPSYHWIYWVGPCLGSVIAATFYHLVRVLEYETANPGQDFNEKEMDRFEFDEENAATGADVVRPEPAPIISPSATGYLGSGSNHFNPMSHTSMDLHQPISNVEMPGKAPAQAHQRASVSPPPDGTPQGGVLPLMPEGGVLPLK